MSAPKVVLELIARFRDNEEAYRRDYGETETRREFLDPFFKALGWDIDNTASNAEAYKDVVHEDSVKVGFSMKAPDYSFRIGGLRKFFLEAKKPSVNIREDRDPAFQLRRYAWSAKLPLSILSNFSQFAIYDCRVRPKQSDKADVARIMHFTYKDYATRWDEIAAIFSKEALYKGSFDKYATSKKKKGTAEVDHSFLEEIEKWRYFLAHNIALRNSKLSQPELNFAVQQTIDRIIFLRICEDRGIEPYGKLKGLQNGDNVYERLKQFFHYADERYNSGLFHFNEEKDRPRPDELTLRLKIDDKAIKDIVGRLYYPESPYEFSVLPADILGQVYEQFLGKVIRLTAGGHARVEDKPEVKKAGGVYYTPSYIVDYIVKETVGKLLDDSTPDKASRLTILDPACGSGSFLLGAYEALLNWHRDWYSANDPETHARGRPPRIYRGPGASWRLTTAERKRILLNNIYGVDIDPQAVEVTKLSLLLKVLEQESAETLGKNWEMFHERALPDLDNNIKCGNSLIGPDFSAGRFDFDDQEQRRINPFDWNAEFPAIKKSKGARESHGFDAVIGNPPWISLTGKFGNEIHTKDEIEYLTSRFRGNTYMPNMYEYFVAQGLNLTKQNGLFSFIVPDRLAHNAQFVDLRKRILSEATIISLGYKAPFPGITADTLIYAFRKAPPLRDWKVSLFEWGKTEIKRLQSDFVKHSTCAFEYFENVQTLSLVNKILADPHIERLDSICDSTSGFGGKSELITSQKMNAKQSPTLKGDSIGRYEFRKGYWFHFCKENITGRTTDTEKLGARPKILLRKTGDRIIATFDDSGSYPEQSLYFLYNNKTTLNWNYILGIMNSKLLTVYYRAKAVTNRNTIAQLKKVDLDQFPIRKIDFADKDDTTRHQELVALVTRMLVLKKQLVTSKAPHDRTTIERQIKVKDQEIDEVVFQLYDLTEEEIKTVNSET